MPDGDIRRAFFLVHTRSIQGGIPEHAFRKALVADGTVHQGGIPLSDHWFDHDSWHRAPDNAWHNELCRKPRSRPFQNCLLSPGLTSRISIDVWPIASLYWAGVPRSIGLLA